MKEKKERIISIVVVLLFLFVISGVNAAGYYDRTFYACGPADCFSLDRGSYEVAVDAKHPDAVSCVVYYLVNGQERVLARAGVKSGVGTSFRMHLPSSIRNDSVRVALLNAAGTGLPQVDVMRLTRQVPVRQRECYLLLYPVVFLCLQKNCGPVC